jgi:glycosyltransferase involved in cell wall biosynthesis
MSIATISLVVPIYNEEAVLPALASRLSTLREDHPEYEFDIIIVDDGSTDRTRDILREFHYRYGFSAIFLSRNFGHQPAVSAGLSQAHGDFIAVIDGDLQDPPEAIPDMVELLKQSRADVVYGVRQNRKENTLMKFCYSAFYRLLQQLSPLEIPLDSGDFSVISSRVAKTINSMPERRRFVRGLRSYAGFKQVPYHYSRDLRAAGEPKYTLSKLFKLAADGIFAFSELPLKAATIIGVIVSILSFATGLGLLIWRLTSGVNLPGFATISVGLFFLGGVQLLSLGIIGEYIGRIHNEVKRRPAYIIESSLGV